MTGGRLKRVLPHVGDDEVFAFTYGDGVADIDVGALIAFHRAHGKRATLTAVAPPGRFGAMEFDVAGRPNGCALRHRREAPEELLDRPWDA